MRKSFIFMCLAIGMLSNGGYNNSFAANSTEKMDDRHVLKIPDGVDIIRMLSYHNRNDFTSVIIPDSVTIIAPQAFVGCANLQNLTIGNSVKYINGGAFAACRSLDNVIIPDSVEIIGVKAFHQCSSLKSLTLGRNVKEIRNNAFEGCGLDKVTIPGGVTRIEKDAFRDCYNLQHLTIENGVQYIEDRAFAMCESLETVTIPDSVTSIDYAAFYGCYNLNKIYVYSDRVKQLVIDSQSGIDLDIIEIIEKPTNTNSYQQTIEEQKLKMQALDEEIANLLANNPVTQERARIKREAEEGYGLELDNDSATFDDTDIYERSRQAYETYKKNEEEIAKKMLRLAKIRESLAKKGGK